MENVTPSNARKKTDQSLQMNSCLLGDVVGGLLQGKCIRPYLLYL
jgi:hypothetical protein